MKPQEFNTKAVTTPAAQDQQVVWPLGGKLDISYGADRAWWTTGVNPNFFKQSG